MSLESGSTAKIPGLGRTVAAGAGWSLAARLTVAGLGLASSAMLTRLLPTDQMGTYLLVASLVLFAGVLFNAGINQLCIRYVAEHVALGEHHLARATFRVLFRIGLICALVGATIGVGLAEMFYEGRHTAGFSVVVGGWVFVTALQALMADGFRGVGDIRSASLYGGPLTSMIMVGGLVAVVAWEIELTVVGALLLVAVATAANTGRGALALRRRVRSLPRTTCAVERLRWTRVFEASLPLVTTTVLLVILTSVDLWVLAGSRPASEVAAYGVAARTATLVGMPLLVLYGVVSPLVAGLYASGTHSQLETMLRTVALIATVPTLLLALLFVIFGGPLLGLMYGDHYRSGAFALACLSIGQVVSVGTGVCGLALTMTGHPRALVASSGGTLVITIALLFLTVPTWGSDAAALVAAGGLAAQNVVTLIAARRLTGLWTSASPKAALQAFRETRE